MGRQDGSSAIAFTFNEPRDIARIELLLATRSLTDYPRELRVDAVDANNRSRTLYNESPYPEFIAGFLRDPHYPPLVIELPSNESLRVITREGPLIDPCGRCTSCASGEESSPARVRGTCQLR